MRKAPDPFPLCQRMGWPRGGSAKTESGGTHAPVEVLQRGREPTPSESFLHLEVGLDLGTGAPHWLQLLSRKELKLIGAMR